MMTFFNCIKFHVLPTASDQLRARVDGIVKCLLMFPQQSPYALLLAASTLTKLVIRGTTTVTIQDRLQLRKLRGNLANHYNVAISSKGGCATAATLLLCGHKFRGSVCNCCNYVPMWSEGDCVQPLELWCCKLRGSMWQLLPLCSKQPAQGVYRCCTG